MMELRLVEEFREKIAKLKCDEVVRARLMDFLLNRPADNISESERVEIFGLVQSIENAVCLFGTDPAWRFYSACSFAGKYRELQLTAIREFAIEIIKKYNVQPEQSVIDPIMKIDSLHRIGSIADMARDYEKEAYKFLTSLISPLFELALKEKLSKLKSR